MKKHIANILCGIRIVLALILLIFFKKISVLFLILYTIAEFTDIIDGTIARKTGSCSDLGSFLDSVSDLLLAANLVKIVFSMKIITKPLAVWLILALLIGASSPIINYLRHKKLFFIHSVPCKACGAIISIVPFAIYFGFIDIYLVIALTLVTFAMIEICVMSTLLDKPDPNAKSLYSVLKERKNLLSDV